MTKKLLSLILCLSMLLTFLVGCADDLFFDPDELSDTALPTNPEDEAPSQETEEPVPMVELTKDGVSRYTVLWDDALSNDCQIHLQMMFEECKKDYNVSFELMSDATVRPNCRQIFVGELDCDEIAYGKKEVQSGEFILSYHKENDVIVILGADQQKTMDGVEYFLETYGNAKTSSFAIPEDLFYISDGGADYPIQYLLINGISVLRHTIIIPKSHDLSTYYAAQNLSDYLSLQMGGVHPEIKTDDTPEQPYEILIGSTNRAESKLSVTPKKGEYVLMQSGTKLVMQGTGIYVGAGNAKLITDYLSGSELNRGVRIKNLPTEATPTAYTVPETYRSSILMIGDGMGFNHISAALANGLDHFVANELPAYGKAITQSQSVINGVAGFTDSAAGGTALSSGYKTLNGYIGKDASGKSYKNIRELAQENGAKTAVVTTDVITGATPAAFLCHNVSRNNTSQLQNEINTLQYQKKVDYLAASVDNALTTKTREALMTIADSSAPFFLMVEEGHIDKKSHSNDTKAMIHCVTRFNDAIAYVIQFVFCHPDTALIISADHETGGLIADVSNAYKYRYTSGDHTNADVPVYAFGPGTEIFNEKRVDNTELPTFLAKAFGNGKIGKAA